MKNITYAEALNEALREELDRNKDVFLAGECIGSFDGIYKVTKSLLRDYGPKRIVDTPISENAIMGLGVGAAMTGLRPVIEIMYINFFLQALDQLINQACKLGYFSCGQFKMPLTVRTQGGAGRRFGGQHTDFFENFFVAVPGLTVVMPSTPADAKALLKTSIRSDDPVVFIEHKLLYYFKGDVPEDDYTLPFGQANIVREGSDVTVIATSLMVHRALEAAEILAKKGINIEIIDPRTIKPLDMDTIVKSVKKTHRAIVVHESHCTGGYGGEVISRIVEEAFDYLDAPPIRMGGIEAPMVAAKLSEDAYIPGAQDIIKAIFELVDK